MAQRSFTVELTDEQARILSEIAQAHGMTPDAVLIEAVEHGLSTIVAGVTDSDLIEPRDRPEVQQSRPVKASRARRTPTPPCQPKAEAMDDDIPF